MAKGKKEIKKKAKPYPISVLKYTGTGPSDVFYNGKKIVIQSNLIEEDSEIHTKPV